MGLDMYLYADKYVSRKDYNTKVGYDYATNETFNQIVSLLNAESIIDNEWSGLQVSLPIGYWRKANAIHNWIVQNCADGVDECQKIGISSDTLTKLLDTCKAVLDNPASAPDLLPPASGFFFGSTDIDQYYFQDLIYTVEILEKALNSDIEYFTYQASW